MSPDSTYLGSVIFDNGPWEVLNRFTLVENLDTVVRFGSAFFFFFFLLVVVLVIMFKVFSFSLLPFYPCWTSALNRGQEVGAINTVYEILVDVISPDVFRFLCFKSCSSCKRRRKGKGEMEK